MIMQKYNFCFPAKNDFCTPEIFSEIVLPAELESLGIFIASVKAGAVKLGLAPGRISEIELAIEEILVNIFSYAYKDPGGTVHLTCGRNEEGRLLLEICDSGVPFNMLESDPPDLLSDISERKIGGLGLFLARKLISDIRYYRENDKNILKITV